MEPTMEAGRDSKRGTSQPLGPVVQIDEGRIQAHLDEVVRSTVEETLNALLDAEADELCGTEGRKDTRAVSEGAKEDKASWTSFLRELKQRGLKGVQLLVSDKCLGLVENFAEFYPEAKWQRCVVHFYRNVWTAVPAGKVKEVAGMLKAIHAQEDAKAAKEKAFQIIEKLKIMRLARAAEIVAGGIDETLSYYRMRSEHWRCLRTNNPLERLMREIRRRTRVVGAFPDGQSALMLVAARLRHVAATKWGTKRYLQMNRLAEIVAIA